MREPRRPEPVLAELVAPATAAEQALRRQLEARFAGTSPAAWKEATAIVAAYSRDVLESRDAFYTKGYRPRRDVLAASWNERAEKQAAL